MNLSPWQEGSGQSKEETKMQKMATETDVTSQEATPEALGLAWSTISPEALSEIYATDDMEERIR